MRSLAMRSRPHSRARPATPSAAAKSSVIAKLGFACCVTPARSRRRAFKATWRPISPAPAPAPASGSCGYELLMRAVLTPNTIMPPYYRVDGLTRVAASYRGKPILSAEQIEDVVAFLSTLKDVKN